MSLRPQTSRCQLTWKQFVQKDDGSWFLNLPPYYAALFASYFPLLMKQSRTGFLKSRSGKTQYAFFASLAPREIQRIEGFLKFFERAVCLGVNKHLTTRFADEVDFCVALDFAKPSPSAERTEIGELEYQAKYQQNSEAIGELQRELAFAVRSLPPDAMPRPRLLAHVPSTPGQQFCLPALLTRGIVDMVPKTFWADPKPLLTPVLTLTKAGAKNLTVDQKIEHWQKLLDADAIQLSRSVQDCSVIVVDDLYQSGASLWSFAKHLKSRGARAVVGATCVKSLRDTDNR